MKHPVYNIFVYLDVDGVIADFDKRAQEVLGMPSRQFEAAHGSEMFWSSLYESPDFFETFEPMEDAHELVDGVRALGFIPQFLTGCPRGGWATAQKLNWRDKFFPDVPMITCLSKEKSIYCRPGDIIIDDWPQHRALWEAKGGHWILHTSAKQSLAELKDLLSKVSE